MTRLISIIVAAFFGLTFQALGQGASLKDQLVGAWSLVSCDPKFAAFTGPCGTNPNGILMYSASGRYVLMVALRGRPKASAIPNLRNSPAEELKTIMSGVIAQFGTYSVNETDKIITGHVDGALFPNVEGTDNEPVTASLSGDELRIGDPKIPGAYNVYRRIK
jgi:Lipocalin-like domain